jgi:hypothetical protein
MLPYSLFYLTPLKIAGTPDPDLNSFTARSIECSVTQIWDRRSLRESNPQPVGVLAGHTDGITYLDTRGDGRFILSNSKDQVRHTSQSKWM